jgi:hypothetical protein
VGRRLEERDDLQPVEAVCSAVRLVMRSYLADPRRSVHRYLLTRSIPQLRDREIASVQRYERVFSKFVRRRLAGTLGEARATLHADVVAAAVVAAHNAVLREWLREGAARDPLPALDAALAWVISTFDQPAVPRVRRTADQAPAVEGSPGASGEGTDVVVAVFRADQPIDDVVERISRSL